MHSHLGPLLILLTGFMIGMAATMAGGPVTILIVKQCLRRNLVAAVALILGLFCTELFYVLIFVNGFASYITKSQMLLSSFLVVGGSYFVLSPLLELVKRDKKKNSAMRAGAWKNFLQGAFIGFTNPALLLFLAFIVSIATSLFGDEQARENLFPYLFASSLGGVVWTLGLAFAVYKFSTRITEARIAQAQRLLSFALLFFGIWMVSKGIYGLHLMHV